ncbi:hypothetical protein [uncultured Phocaeicola sp.]|uniref:hypothetical protein n=1 Tax=uncultured Phocaeicola sp. TaxID=990718 RepID=UPI0026007414|nr:hypothetical protein [uncultured Phocaeicola sp.]
MENFEFTPVQTTPFSLSTKIKIRLWNFINCTFFRWSPFFARKYRVWLTRCFGSKIDYTCSLDNQCKIVAPWLLTMGAYSSLGEGSLVKCRAEIKIGSRTCIGKDVIMMSGSHNINSLHFEFITKPITIGDNVWVATRSMIQAGVTIGDWAVIGAMSLVTKDVESWSIVGGIPAKFIKKRIIKD